MREFRILNNNFHREYKSFFYIFMREGNIDITCTGKVGAADIDFFTIEDEHLEMHARTERPFHPVDERRVLVEILAKRRSRFLGMDEPNFNAPADKLRQQFEERHLHTVLFLGGAILFTSSVGAHLTTSH